MKKQLFCEILLVSILLVAQTSSAEVLIHQVLYDPFQESGSEAVELVNTGSVVVDISGWQIESDQFSPDAALPNGSRIDPAGFFLVADKNWSKQKDNSSWPDADYEETISLKNGIGGIALKDKNNRIIDSVGWGEGNKFVKGSVAPATKEGQSLMLATASENNSASFVAVTPAFAGKQNAIVLLEITLPQVSVLNAFLLEDDDSRSGIQIMPVTGSSRNLIVRAIVQHGTPVLEFLNKSTEMTLLDNNTWGATLQLSYFTASGNVSASVRVGSQVRTVDFEVLANKAWYVEPRKTLRSVMQGEMITQEFEILNKGNVVVDLRIADMLLQGDNMRLRGTVDKHNIQLLPTQQATVQTSISVSLEASGMFSGVLEVQETEK